MQELYTIEPEEYRREEVFDEYVSIIWTERFIESGEFQLVVPATETFHSLLTRGTLLGHSQSRQPMLIDTCETKDGQITATGKTLLEFFNERHIDAFTMTASPGHILATIVDNMQTKAALEGVPIPRLFTGVEADGDDVTEKVPAGPAGPTLQDIAKKYAVGMGVYRVASDLGGFELHFSTRVGEDLTSAIRFSPSMDNITNIKDLVSDAQYKSMAVTRPPTNLSVLPPPVIVYNQPGDEYLSAFQARVLDVDCTDLSEDDIGPASDALKLSMLHDLMEFRARKALDNIVQTDIVDGEVTLGAQYRYYEEPNPDGLPVYQMGDQVSVTGNYGQVRRSHITEFIRSQDNTGARAYPTLAANLGPKGLPKRPPRKTTRTFIVGPADSPIAEGTIVPEYYSHTGTIIAYRHIFHGGGTATIEVYARGSLIASVDVDGTHGVTKQDPPFEMTQGDPIYVKVTSVASSPSGLAFSVVYG